MDANVERQVILDRADELRRAYGEYPADITALVETGQILVEAILFASKRIEIGLYELRVTEGLRREGKLPQ